MTTPVPSDLASLVVQLEQAASATDDEGVRLAEACARAVLFDAVAAVGSGDLHAPGRSLAALRRLRRVRDPVSARERAQRVVHAVAWALEVADGALSDARAEGSLRRGATPTRRAVLRVLLGAERELRRGEVRDRAEALGVRVSAERIGQVLAELHASGVVDRIVATARGGRAGFYFVPAALRPRVERVLASWGHDVPLVVAEEPSPVTWTRGEVVAFPSTAPPPEPEPSAADRRRARRVRHTWGPAPAMYR